jgi:hypothetical protein
VISVFAYQTYGEAYPSFWVEIEVLDLAMLKEAGQADAIVG